MKLTRHNGRSGKHGTYNPKHNDRTFDVSNSEHIDEERAKHNVYWDCFNGYRTFAEKQVQSELADTFEEVEELFYSAKYGAYVEAQNARNDKNRHSERNRTTTDLLKDKRTCPEETIYQIGKMGDHVSPDVLLKVVTDFFVEMERRFGSHVHILDWALHLDEATPHIQERHVFDCENRYGEICPQQEKALEALGFELPDPTKKQGRHNNRKMTFDSACRAMLFDIAKRHGLHLEQEPEYGGRAYLEKQDFILAKQKEQLEVQEQRLEELTLKIDGKKVLIQADRAKTKSSLRTLPLVPPIRDRLLMLKGQQDTYRRLCGKSYNRDYLGYLCVDEIGNIIRPNYVSEQFPKLLEKNGLRPIRFHDLRHSCASLLLANGVPMKQIQEWLGHSDFSTTANIYAHLDYASKLSSAQAMLEGLGYGNASA